MAINAAPSKGARATRTLARSVRGRKTCIWPAKNLSELSGEGRRDLLGGHVHCKISQTSKCKAAMSTWKTPPSIMQYMMICFLANINRHQQMFWCSFLRLASSNEIRSRSPDGILHNICEERSQSKANEKTEYCNMGLVGPRADDGRPNEDYQ